MAILTGTERIHAIESTALIDGCIEYGSLGVESERRFLFAWGLAVAAVTRVHIGGFAVGGTVGGEVSEERRESGDAGYEDL